MRGNFHVRFCERLWCKQPYNLLDLDASTKRVLERGERLTQILKQDQFSTMSTSVQAVLLYAGSNGFLDVLSLSQLDAFMTLASNDLADYEWPFLETIIATKDFDQEAEKDMKQYILDTVECVQQHS